MELVYVKNVQMYDLCKMLHHHLQEKLGLQFSMINTLKKETLAIIKKIQLQSIERNLLSERNQIPQSKD